MIIINAIILEKLSKITAEEQKLLSGTDEINKELYMEKCDGVINSKKMLSKGELIAVRPHTRFVHFPLHTHDYVEVIYMCKGKTTHIVDGDKITLNEGELLFLCQSAKQEILPAKKDDIAVNFIILPEFFDGILKMIGKNDTPLFRFLIDCLTNKRQAKGYLHFLVADILPVQNLAENLIWTLFCDKKTSYDVNRTTMGLLLMQLAGYTERLISQPEEEKLTVKVLKYIEENYKDGTLCELSNFLHYDISALSREIKMKTGKNFTELLQEKRISKACFLLESTDINVEDVAKAVGYENISFFHKLFKTVCKTSPKKYRTENKAILQ